MPYDNELSEKIEERALAHPSANAPVRLTHSEADSETSIEATRAYFEKLLAPSKTFISYPEARHELHNDLIRATVLKNYLEWIQAKCGLRNANSAA